MNKPNAPCSCGSGMGSRYCCNNIKPGSERKKKVANLVSDARTFEAEGDLEAAIRIYSNIISRNKFFHPAFWQLGQLLIEIGDVNAGLTALKYALQYHPKPTDLIQQAATKIESAGKPREANALIRHILKSHKDNANTLMALASNQEKMGRFGSAIKTLNKINLLTPGNGTAISALARCLRLSGEIESANDLLQSYLRQENEHKNQSHLAWRELGFVQEKRGEYPSAFQSITRAGQLKLSQPEVEAIGSSQRYKELESYKDWILSAKLNDLKSVIRKEHRHVFFVGFPRSGTTLTEQILASHSEVKSSQEKELLYHVTRTLKKQHPSASSIIDLLDLADETSLNLAREAYWRCVEKLFGSNFSVFVDKLPLNITCLPLINKVFPNAKVIVALRDPRDVCFSCFFQNFGINASMKNFLSWQTTVEFYSAVMGHWLDIRDYLTLDYMEIRYEDTVSNFPDALKPALKFLELEWQDAMAEFTSRTSQEYIDTPSFQSIRMNVSKSAMGKWKNYPDAARDAESALHNLITAFGYQ